MMSLGWSEDQDAKNDRDMFIDISSVRTPMQLTMQIIQDKSRS